MISDHQWYQAVKIILNTFINSWSSDQCFSMNYSSTIPSAVTFTHTCMMTQLAPIIYILTREQTGDFTRTPYFHIDQTREQTGDFTRKLYFHIDQTREQIKSRTIVQTQSHSMMNFNTRRLYLANRWTINMIYRWSIITIYRWTKPK